jgi:hypothetical protein
MALQKEKATKMANYGYLSIVWAFLWQILLYGSLSTLSVLGAVLVSGYAVVATLKGSDIEKRITNFLTESWNRWCWCGGTRASETEEGTKGHQLLVESASVREERGWGRESEEGEGEGDVELQVMGRKQQCEEDNESDKLVEVKVKEEGLTVNER